LHRSLSEVIWTDELKNALRKDISLVQDVKSFWQLYDIVSVTLFAIHFDTSESKSEVVNCARNVYKDVIDITTSWDSSHPALTYILELLYVAGFVLRTPLPEVCVSAILDEEKLINAATTVINSIIGQNATVLQDRAERV
jgi:hypothetical protein